jgi:hypothetical protein
MVYITGHTFTSRQTNSVTAKVYANCDSVELFVNGTSQGNITSTNCIFTWPVTLSSGTNLVKAIGNKGKVQVSDALVWFAPAVKILDKVNRSAEGNSTKDALDLSNVSSSALPSSTSAQINQKNKEREE